MGAFDGGRSRSPGTDGARAGAPPARGRGGLAEATPPPSEIEPAVLLVGAEQSFHTAIAGALAQHGVHVETVAPNSIVETAMAAAPDLIVLVGEAAQDGGSALLARLQGSPHSSVVPVAILADEAGLDERLRAFRHGAAAVIPRSASVDAIADRISQLAREIPDREGSALGDIGEATLEDLVTALSKELRTGILSIRKGASESEAVRVVLGGGRPLAETIDEFVSRIRRHVVHAEPLQYEFDERAGGTVGWLESTDAEARDDDVTGLRVLLADEDAPRADAVAQALRRYRAEVVVTDVRPGEQRFARLRQLDPAILLIDEELLRGEGFALVKRMRGDTRLRWASLLVVRWQEVWADDDSAPAVPRMLGPLATLAEPEHSIKERADAGMPFDTRLEVTGPARLLRVLASRPHTLRVSVYNPRVTVHVTLSGHLIAGARGHVLETRETLEGAKALSTLLVLSSGRVHVQRLDEADSVNIMSPVEVALSLADGEAPPIQPSIPAPSAADSEETTLSLAQHGSGRKVTDGALRWALALSGVGLVAAFVALLVWTLNDPGVSEAAGEEEGGPASSVMPAAHAASAAPAAASAAPAIASAPPVAAVAAAEGGAEAAAGDARSASASSIDEALALESRRTAPSCEALVGPGMELLDGQPAKAIAEVRAGRRALVIGKVEEAQKGFCRAIAMDSTNGEALASLTRVLLLRRDPAAARKWAERAARHAPDDKEAQALHADVLARVGEHEEARRIWIQAADVDPNDAATVRGVAHTYARAASRAIRGTDYSQADRLYRRAVILDPTSGTAAGGLARALTFQAELEAARWWAERAVGLEPKNVELRVLLGDVYEKVGTLDKAHEAWRTAYALDPRDSRVQARMRKVSREAQ